jgi:hypothetical protein
MSAEHKLLRDRQRSNAEHEHELLRDRQRSKYSPTLFCGRMTGLRTDDILEQ